MQKRKRTIREVCCLLLVLIGGLSVQNPEMIYASEPKEELQIELKDFKPGEDAKEEFSPEIIYEKETGSMTVSFQTMEQEEGEYPISVFENTKQKLSGYAGVNIKVKNASEEVKANVLFSTQNGQVLVLEDETDVVLKQNKNYKIEKVSYGAFRIPANFEGEIYIPFSSFIGEDEKLKNELETGIYGLGFTFVAPQQKQISIEIQEISFLPYEENSISYFGISGDENVLRHSIGESVSTYQVEFFDWEGRKTANPYKMSYDITKDGKRADGITIDENGTLTVTAGAKEGEYLLTAENEQKESTCFTIELKKSWTETQKTANGYDASMVLPDEVVKVVEDDSVWMNQRYLLVGKICAALAAGAFFIYYICKRRKHKDALKKEFYGEEE